MKRQRDDTKVLDVLTQWLPGVGFNSSGCAVVRISSGDNAPVVIPVVDREERKQFLDRWIVERYNEAARCASGRYCQDTIANIADEIGRSEETVRNTIRRYSRGGLTALSSS